MASTPQDPVSIDDLPTGVRLAKMESDIGAIKTSIVDIRADLRATNTRIDGINGRLDGFALESGLADVKTDLRQLRSKVDYLLYWMIGSQAALLAIMAHGFKWV